MHLSSQAKKAGKRFARRHPGFDMRRVVGGALHYATHVLHLRGSAKKEAATSWIAGNIDENITRAIVEGLGEETARFMEGRPAVPRPPLGEMRKLD